MPSTAKAWVLGVVVLGMVGGVAPFLLGRKIGTFRGSADDGGSKTSETPTGPCSAARSREAALLKKAGRCELDADCRLYPCKCFAIGRTAAADELMVLDEWLLRKCGEPLTSTYCGDALPCGDARPVCVHGTCEARKARPPPRDPRAPHELTKAEVVEGMRMIEPSVDDCYDRFKTPGVARTEFTIEKDGTVSSARVTNELLAGTATGRCVERAAEQAKFGASVGLKVAYPFRLGSRP